MKASETWQWTRARGACPSGWWRPRSTLLAEEGPAAIKVRSVAAACGLSTMVVYSHFGGVPELVGAVADHGFEELGRAFSTIPVTEDPVTDLFAMAIRCRQIAQANPHLYDLMFGLSTRATYRPAAGAGSRLSGHSPAFKAGYTHVTDGCARLVASGRITPADPVALAASLWSYVHGYISLELADHFIEFEDPLTQVLVPMGVIFCVGLGDSPDRALTSHQEALSRYAVVAESARD